MLVVPLAHPLLKVGLTRTRVHLLAGVDPIPHVLREDQTHSTTPVTESRKLHPSWAVGVIVSPAFANAARLVGQQEQFSLSTVKGKLVDIRLNISLTDVGLDVLSQLRKERPRFVPQVQNLHAHDFVFVEQFKFNFN